jgi:hypothetical protein
MVRNTPRLRALSIAIPHITFAFLFGCFDLSAPRAWCQAPHTASTPPAKSATAKEISGKVAETMNAATYTYVLIDTGKQKVWAAAPQFAVKKGDSVAIADPMEMRNFQSQALKRTFDVVYFTGSVKVNGIVPTAGASAQSVELPPNHPPVAGGGTTKPAIKLAEMKKAEGGMRIAEIFAGKEQLKGKPVKVRGQVVKYNPEVMGKNWIHIQDGTGSAGSNDLTVTTSSTTKIGDVILVTGTVATDRDFGGGYRYSLIVEEAKVTVE